MVLEGWTLGGHGAEGEVASSAASIPASDPSPSGVCAMVQGDAVQVYMLVPAVLIHVQVHAERYMY